MKATRMVHPSHARTVLSDSEVTRLLAQGWLEYADTRASGKRAIIQRKLRRRRKLLGYKRFTAYLLQADFDNLMAYKLRGETNEKMLLRLLHTSS